VAALTAIIWFSGGVGLALASVYASQAANGKRRGLAFSVQSLASPLAALFGGLAVGHIAEWKGYPFMFATLALVWAIWPALALTKIRNGSEKGAPAPKQSSTPTEKPSSAQPTSAFSHLLLAVLLSAITVSIGRLGLSLVMKEQAFSLIEISSTSTISGLAAMPVILILGSYSDRLGHQRMLIFTYLVAALGTFTLVAANHLWQYWLSAILLLVALNSSRSLAIATATATLSSQQQARRLPWIYTTNWAAGIVGFAASGILIEILGSQTLFLGAAGLSLLSALLTGSPWQHISAWLPTLNQKKLQS
jgi:MFS family permease